MDKYGLKRAARAVALLVPIARGNGNIGGVQAGKVAGISSSHADSIRTQLRVAGIVCGGPMHIALSRPPEQITLAQVAAAVCEPTTPTRKPQELIALAATYLQAIKYAALADKTLADVIREADALKIGVAP